MQSERIRIVLVGTSHPGNIGAAARAMKTMGLVHLSLVEPKEYPCAEASARASGATDVLAAARVCATLEEALEGCVLVIGASARVRSIAWPQVDVREAALLAARESEQGPVALVFGREKWGLSNDELELCNYLMQIPSNPAYSSLNLAMSVQVASYELRMAAGGGEPPPQQDSPPATAEQMAGLYRHLEQTLYAIGFLNPAAPRQAMRRLKRLYNRARLEQIEVQILRGILSKTQDQVNSGDCAKDGRG